MANRRFLLLAIGLLIFSPVAGANDQYVGAPDPHRSLPTEEILAGIRSQGFAPVGKPASRGLRYEVAAVDPYGFKVRVVVDAESGSIVAVRGLPLDPGPLVGGQAYAQWPFRRLRETRPVPPASIPSARSAELRTPLPLPRPRPDDITGSIKIVPVAPME